MHGQINPLYQDHLGEIMDFLIGKQLVVVVGSQKKILIRILRSILTQTKTDPNPQICNITFILNQKHLMMKQKMNAHYLKKVIELKRV